MHLILRKQFLEVTQNVFITNGIFISAFVFGHVLVFCGHVGGTSKKGTEVYETIQTNHA